MYQKHVLPPPHMMMICLGVSKNANSALSLAHAVNAEFEFGAFFFLI